MHYRHVYPPVRYVFYPLYRLLRRRFRFGMRASYMLTWVTSGLLHGVIMSAFGSPVAGAVCALVFVLLGGLGTIFLSYYKVIRRTKNQSE